MLITHSISVNENNLQDTNPKVTFLRCTENIFYDIENIILHIDGSILKSPRHPLVGSERIKGNENNFSRYRKQHFTHRWKYIEIS